MEYEEASEISSEYKSIYLDSNTIHYNNLMINMSTKDTVKQDDISDIIPTSIKIIYSIPSFGKMSCLVLLNIHALLFYESMGASLLYLSFFVALARAVEILLKPFIAHVSDVTKSKWGRRMPYMFFGSLIYAYFLITLFTPPSMKADANYLSIWFGICYVFFFIADTIANVPYLALGPELSTNSKEREKLYIYFYLFQYIGVLFAAATPVLLTRFNSQVCDCNFCINNPKIIDVLECNNQCKIFCNLKTNRNSLLYLSVFISVVYITSIILIMFKIKEKNQGESHSSFIPSLFRVINNKPFTNLLIPWILDIMLSTIFGTMLPFYLNFVINPQKYCLQNNIDLDNDRCNVNMILGYSISIFFIGCIISMSIWHQLVKIFGKKRCWETYSLVSILTFSLFIMCDSNSIGLILFASICCSIPAGGAYLNDVFCSDIIDYDEFLTNQRNEGLYTVFSSFIPKIVSIFAQSTPFTIMSFLGFVSSNKGEAMDQPQPVVEFIRFYFIGVPCILALISFYFKLKYPINDDKILEKIKNTNQLQNECMIKLQENYDYFRIKDPVFNHPQIKVFTKNKMQEDTLKVAEHFYDKDYLRILHDSQYTYLRTQIRNNIITSVVVILVFMTTLLATFTLLENKALSLIPLFSLFVVSIAIMFLILNIIRYSVIDKVVNGEYIIDKNFLNLLINKKNYEDSVFDRKKIIEDKSVSPISFKSD